jgi:hypothetical protein
MVKLLPKHFTNLDWKLMYMMSHDGMSISRSERCQR